MSGQNRFALNSLDGVVLVHSDGTKEYVKDMKIPEEEAVETSFADYLKAAWTQVQMAAESGTENGDLAYFNGLCRRGVRANWSALEPKSFLENYHRCIAVIAKRVAVVEKFLPSQVVLFRDHDAARIIAEQESIWDEWKKKKRFMNSKMVNAMIETSKLLNGRWDWFKGKYLRMPVNPESESLTDWMHVHQSLDQLPMVGWANAWYLIRNLYGAPVFKPDVHICAIAGYFFPNAEEPLTAMSQAVRELWEDLCDNERFLPVHLGEIDYILWWYRQATGLPEIQAHACASC